MNQQPPNFMHMGPGLSDHSDHAVLQFDDAFCRRIIYVQLQRLPRSIHTLPEETCTSSALLVAQRPLGRACTICYDPLIRLAIFSAWLTILSRPYDPLPAERCSPWSGLTVLSPAKRFSASRTDDARR